MFFVFLLDYYLITHEKFRLTLIKYDFLGSGSEEIRVVLQIKSNKKPFLFKK